MVLGRCDGQCCARFIMRQSYPQLLEWRDQAESDPTGASGGWEIAMIANMLVPLGMYEAGDVLPEGVVLPEHEYPRFAYTCKFFNGADCTNYEHRPKMCRTHGIQYECQYIGCVLYAGCARPERQLTGGDRAVSRPLPGPILGREG